jgi:motility quorum-sensing regulator/GCU-specific mRNA interferase toxin
LFHYKRDYGNISLMEKRKPHYDLKMVKSLLCSEETRQITQTSRKGAVFLGYMDELDMVSLIETITSRNFFKSMTSQYDPCLWQDVYRIVDENGQKIYVKLQLWPTNKKAAIIQFKEDTGGGY